MLSESSTSRVYTDFSGLAKLKVSARQDDPESIRAVAKELESTFVEMMVKSMREAGQSESMMDNNASRTYQDMFDKQIAVDISERGDFGIADVIERQLNKTAGQMVDKVTVNKSGQMPVVEQGIRGFGPTNQAATVAHDTSQKPLIDLRRRGRPLRSIYANHVPSTKTQLQRSGEGIASTAGVRQKDSHIGVSKTNNTATFRSPKEFVEVLRPHADAAAKEIGVDPDLLIAQAALETGWGKKMIRNQDGSNSHNLFGIKGNGGWKGRSVNVSSLEYRNGVARKEVSLFRSYSSFEESFKDYVNFIKDQPRYQKAVSVAGDRDAYIRTLQRSGYATDPNYANKVINILERKSLQNAWKPSA